MTAAELSDTKAREKPSWKAAIRGNVLAMGLVSLFTDFSSEMMNPLLPVFVAAIVGGAKAALWVGLMDGIAETTASLLKIFSGRISDKTGRRKGLVVLGYGASSVARPLMALAGFLVGAAGGALVVVMKFLDRVGKGIRTSPRDALIGDSVPREVRGLAFSFHRSMDHAGAVLGPLAAIAILYCVMGRGMLMREHSTINGALQVGHGELVSLQWVFAAAVIPGIAAMAAAIFKVREIPPVKSASAAAGKPDALPRRFYAYLGIVTLFALGNSSDMFIVLLAATKFHMSLLMLLVLWMVFHISKITFSIPGGMLSDKLGRRPVIIAGWLMYALVYLGFALANPDAQWQFWTLILAYGFYFGMTEGAEKALVADFVPSERRGTAFGLYNGAIGIAALPASLVFGVLWTMVEKSRPGMGPVVAFGIGAALAGLASVMLAVLLSTGKKVTQST